MIQTRQEEILQTTTTWLTSHSLHEFSLRKLAQDTTTSARMVLYYFDSKEALIEAVLANITDHWLSQATIAHTQDPNCPPEETLRALWHTLTQDSNAPLLTLIFEAWVLGIQTKQDPYLSFATRTSQAWLKLLESILGQTFPQNQARTHALLLVCALEGLLLYWLTMPELEITAAFELLLQTHLPKDHPT